MRESKLATWIAHSTRLPSVRPQRRTTTMASPSDGLAHQARIPEVPAGTVFVHTLCPWWGCRWIVLVEVDDLATGSKRAREAEFQQRFQAAFRFRKWEKREAGCAGRRIRQRDQYVLVEEKYILEKLHPVLLREKLQKDRRLTLDEFERLRSLVYKISGVPKESCPEAFTVCVHLGATLESTHCV